jgi:hypothetical protein
MSGMGGGIPARWHVIYLALAGWAIGSGLICGWAFVLLFAQAFAPPRPTLGRMFAHTVLWPGLKLSGMNREPLPTLLISWLLWLLAGGGLIVFLMR